MQITLSPVLMDGPYAIARAGDVLTIDGEAFDFSALPEGGTLPAEAIASDWFAGPVERIDGTLHVSLILPHGSNAPEATRFPEPITLIADGPVVLPDYDEEPEE